MKEFGRFCYPHPPRTIEILAHTERFLMTCGLILCVFSACATPSKKSTDSLTPTEQWLFCSAIKRRLKDFDVGIPKGANITLTATDLRVDQSLNGR